MVYKLSEEAGYIFRDFFNEMEDKYERMEYQGKMSVLGLIGKASVSKSRFCNGKENTTPIEWFPSRSQTGYHLD